LVFSLSIIKMKSFRLLALLIAMTLVTSCSRSGGSAAVEIPGVDVKAQNWNTLFKLTDDPILSNSHKNGDPLMLHLQNSSSTPIVFPDNYGLGVLSKEGDRWVSVVNNFYNAGSDYLPTRDSWPSGVIVTALPYIPNLSAPTTIRVYVVGHQEKKSDDLLGAYLDFTLQP
jgi:hypothetical protein